MVFWTLRFREDDKVRCLIWEEYHERRKKRPSISKKSKHRNYQEKHNRSFKRNFTIGKAIYNYRTGDTISNSEVIKKEVFTNFVPNRPIRNIIIKTEELKEPDETTPLKEKYTKDLSLFILKIQDEFLCPMLVKIMSNPYITIDSHTYDLEFLNTQFAKKGPRFPSPYGSQSSHDGNTIIYINNNEIAQNKPLKKLIDLCQEARLINEEKFDLKNIKAKAKEILDRQRHQQNVTSDRESTEQRVELIHSYMEWRAELKLMLKKIPKIIAFYIVGASVLIPDIILFNIVRRESLNPALNSDALGSSCDDFAHGEQLSTNYLASFKQLEAKVDKGLFFLLPLTLVFFIAASNQTKWRKALYFGMGVAFLFLLGSLLTAENPAPDLLTNILFTCLTASGFSDFCDTLINDEDAAKKTAKECIHKELGEQNAGMILGGVYFAFLYTMIITGISQYLYDKTWHLVGYRIHLEIGEIMLS